MDCRCHRTLVIKLRQCQTTEPYFTLQEWVGFLTSNEGHFNAERTAL